MTTPSTVTILNFPINQVLPLTVSFLENHFKEYSDLVNKQHLISIENAFEEMEELLLEEDNSENAGLIRADIMNLYAQASASSAFYIRFTN